MGDTGLFAAAAGVNSINSIGSAYSSAQATKAQAGYQSKMLELNQQVSEQQADDAINRGNKEASAHLKQTKQLVGTERVAYAGQGVDVNYGSAADVQHDTKTMGALDALTIKNNAYREAMGYRVQALNYGDQARFTGLAAANEARNTLLTGGMRALAYGTESAAYLAGQKKSGGKK